MPFSTFLFNLSLQSASLRAVLTLVISDFFQRYCDKGSPPEWVRRGWMYMKGENDSGFQRRYFCLSDIGKLEWYDSQQERSEVKQVGEAEGWLECAGVHVQTDPALLSEHEGARFGCVLSGIAQAS